MYALERGDSGIGYIVSFLSESLLVEEIIGATPLPHASPRQFYR